VAEETVEIGTGLRYSAEQVDDLQSPLELDLIAVFSEMQEEVMRVIDRGVDEGWTPDRIMQEIEEALQ
jgi:hypothetical protein